MSFNSFGFAVMLPMLCCAPAVGGQNAVGAERRMAAGIAWSAADGVPVEVEKASFTIRAIDDEIFSRIEGRSYGSGCTVPRDDLRYLSVLHYDGRDSIRCGEMICHKDIAADLIEIFRNLYRERYPIEKMVLIDEYDADDEASMADNNTSCFNFRRVAGSKKLSNHAYGRAVDINPRYNPYVRRRRDGSPDVRPANGMRFVDRAVAGNPYVIKAGDVVCREFKRRGFRWGGDWRRYKDYQHFGKVLRK